MTHTNQNPMFVLREAETGESPSTLSDRNVLTMAGQKLQKGEVKAMYQERVHKICVALEDLYQQAEKAENKDNAELWRMIEGLQNELDMLAGMA